MKKDINLILIPAVTRNPVMSLFFDEETRLAHLLATIKSVKEKVPSAYIVVMEGGTFSEEDEQKKINAGAHNIFNYDLVKNGKRLPDPNRTKSYGEMTLFLEYFNSLMFTEIKDNILSISKAGGRIILNEKFVFDSSEKCVMNFSHSVWSGLGACSGRYWKIPISKFSHFIKQLAILADEYVKTPAIIDIEHGFYQFNVVPLEGLEANVLSGVSLFVSSHGNWEES
jgi:hypothetical protein